MATNEEKEVIAENLDRIDAGDIAVSDMKSSEDNQFHDADGGDDSILKWLIPLILLGLLIALGYWFCGKPAAPTTPANTSANTNKTNATSNTNTANK